MVRRLEINSYPAHGCGGLFEPSGGIRRLRVVIDSELLAARVHGAETQESLLAGLLTREAIQTWQYRDNRHSDTGGAEPSDHLVPWVVATALENQAAASHSVRWAEEFRDTVSAIHGNMVQVAYADTAHASYSELAPSDAAERRAADAAAVGSAEAVHADLFITDRPYATGRRWPTGGVTVCTPTQALPIVGLYLRSRREFAVWGSASGKDALDMNRGLYYRVGARDMLTAGWRWGSACNQHEPAGLGAVAMAVFDRFARTLRVRDDLLRATNRTQNNDIAEDILLALDTCLLMMMGAFDSAARVAHVALALKGSSFYAGWQKGTWWPKVEKEKPALAGIVRPADGKKNDPGADGAALLTLLGRLRNTVHAAGLQTIAVVEIGAPRQTLVALPSVDQKKIVAAADRLGGRAAWGIRELPPDGMYVDPAILLDRLLLKAAQLLNNLMDATPVEQLDGVTLTAEMRQSPTNDEVFSEECRRSVRWLLGLTESSNLDIVLAEECRRSFGWLLGLPSSLAPSPALDVMLSGESRRCFRRLLGL